MEWWRNGVMGRARHAAPQDSATPLLQCSVFNFLPYVANQFAAQALLARLHTGHHAAGGGDNRRAHAAEDARDFRRADVTPQARPAHPLQARDDASAGLELEPQRA